MRESGAQFVVNLESNDVSSGLICRLAHAGPAHLALSLRESDAQQTTIRRFYRTSGLLEGSFLAMAVLAGLVALVIGEQRYLLLAGWLLLSMRMAAISLGTDQDWLGLAIPADQLSNTRKFTVTAYYLLTYAVFTVVATRRPTWTLFGWSMWLGQVTPLLLIAAAIFLSFEAYLPVMWGLVGFGSILMMANLAYLLVRDRTQELALYSAALVVVFVCSMGEVVAAAFGWRSVLLVFNSVTAALASSGLVAWALSANIRRERDSRMRASRELENVYESTPIALFTCDPSFRLIRVNATFEQLFGPVSFAADGLGPFLQDHVGKLPSLSHHGLPKGQFQPQGRSKVFYLSNQERDGLIHGSIKDISELAEAQRRQRDIDSRDRLTGLMNRSAIEQVIDAQRSTANDKTTTPALLYINLRRFRVLNQTFRHKAGDAVLIEVARRLEKLFGSDDRVHGIGRLNADEFVVVLQAASTNATRSVLRDALAALNNQPYTYARQIFDAKACGVVLEILEQYDPEDLFSIARRAARDSSGSVFDQHAALLTDYESQRSLIKLFSAPQLPIGLQLFAQPIVSLDAPEQNLCFEVLLRLRDTEGQPIPIQKALEAAVTGGNMPRLDLWVLRECLTVLANDHQAFSRINFFSVNISGASLNDEAFLDAAYKILDAHPEIAKKLSIEITESVAVADYRHTNAFIDELRSRGVSVSLDDFGTGYTSYEYVLQLRADALKIDKIFVGQLHEHPASVAVATSIVDLATNLGMRTVAEGVETLESLAVLREINANYAQGFLIAKAMPLETMLSLPNSIAAIKDPIARQKTLDALSDIPTGRTH